ncbi:MAG: DUF3108 domain-containing protein [Stellaceae bacterium]
MRFIPCPILAGMAAVALLGFCTGAAPSAQAHLFSLRFEIFGFAGLHVATERTRVETSASRYAIAMDVETRGLASVFDRFESHSQVRGRLVGDLVRPEEFTGEVRRNGMDRRTRLDYDADGMVSNDWNSPSVEPAAFVPAKQTRGTVDQLTAYFLLERQLSFRGTCNSVIPVFDGVHRYNLRFADAPPQPLPEKIKRHFPGPVRICAMSRQDIGGPGDHSYGTYAGKIWYVRLGREGRVVPVHMEFDTELGSVTGYLVALRGPGINLRLRP